MAATVLLTGASECIGSRLLRVLEEGGCAVLCLARHPERVAVDLPEGRDGVFEIGGLEVVSYGELMREYARLRGLRRLRISVPVLTPRLSGLWLGLVTPAQASVGRALVEGLRNPTRCGGYAGGSTAVWRPSTTDRDHSFARQRRSTRAASRVDCTGTG